MEGFTITRCELAKLLRSLGGDHPDTPVEILQIAWRSSRKDTGGEHLPNIRGPLPPIVEKLMRSGERKGLSLHEIAELGQLTEYAGTPSTALQNWVKRDFKTYFDCPKAGKKYSLEQAALLFMIDDLKINLDFESIRRLFAIVFGCGEPAPQERAEPIGLYACYASIYEELKRQKRQGQRYEELVRRLAGEAADALAPGGGPRRDAVRNMILLAVVSVQSASYQEMARRYCQATLYLGSR